MKCLDLKSRGDDEGARRLLQDVSASSKVTVGKLDQVEQEIAAEQHKRQP